MISDGFRFISVALLVLMPAFGHGETMDELVKRDGLFFRKFFDVPYTGSVDGKVRGSFVDGKKMGLGLRSGKTALWILGVVIKWVKEMANGRATFPQANYFTEVFTKMA